MNSATNSAISEPVFNHFHGDADGMKKDKNKIAQIRTHLEMSHLKIGV